MFPADVFVFSNQSSRYILWLFGEIMSFDFHLITSECGAYLAVDQSLVYGGYPKLFLLFFSLI